MLVKAIRRKARKEKNKIEWRVKKEVKHRAKEALKAFLMTTLLNLAAGGVLVSIVLFVVGL